MNRLGERGLAGVVGDKLGAISAYHQIIDGKGVGSNDKVCKLLSGVFNLRPPQPKYTFIWDVQTILEYIKVNCRLTMCFRINFYL